MRQRCAFQDDRGASLVLALIFLTLFGVTASALLTFTEVSFKNTSSFRDTRQETYAADGAIDAAIAAMRDDLAMGTSGGDCDFQLRNASGVAQIDVDCVPDGGSGAGDGRIPKNAVLTLSSDPEEGIFLDKNDALFVKGAVYSNSIISLGTSANSSLKAVGTITTESAGTSVPSDCPDDEVVALEPPSGLIANSDLKRCVQATSNGDDPGWAALKSANDASFLIPKATWSDCTVSGDVVVAEFEPGQYWLSPTSMLAATPCAAVIDGKGKDKDKSATPASVIYLQPGSYYFNDVTWTVGEYDVVGGTDTGWLGDSAPPIHADGGCDPEEDGVQLILAGNSRLDINDTAKGSTFTLCADPNASGPEIALWAPATTAQGYALPNGSLATGPYPAAGLAGLQVGEKPYVYVHGTTYLPKLAADLWLHNSTQEKFDRGIVTRALVFHASPSLTQTEAAISIPLCDSSPGDCRADREVLLRASTPARLVIQARVHFFDFGGSAPGLRPDVEAWSVQR